MKYKVVSGKGVFESNSRNAKKHLRELDALRVDVYAIKADDEVLVSSAWLDKSRNIVFFGAVPK